MHKLVEYVCDELKQLEKKAEKGSMSATEIEYADKLASLKKNLLKGDMLYEETEGYSEEMGSYARGGNRGNYDGISYARGRRGNVRRDSMGRYSRDGYGRGGYSRSADDMVEQLRDLMEDAPDEQTRKEFDKFIRKMESM